MRLGLGLCLGVGLSACTSLSGLDAKKEFACPAPVGVLCEDMSQIYARTQNGTLPSQIARADPSQKRTPPTPSSVPVPTPGSSKTSAASVETLTTTKPLYSGMPIRSTPKVLRVWINAWVDAEGDLHDQSFLYVMVSQGAWQVDHNRRRILDTYGPVQAPERRPAPKTAPISGPGARGTSGEATAVVGSYRDQALSGATMITPGMVLPSSDSAPEVLAP